MVPQMMRRGSPFLERVRSALLYTYLLRVQIAGFLLLCPVARWAFGTPLFRGLADIPTLLQVFGVGLIAGFQSTFLVITSNLVLLWGRLRLEGRERPARPGVGEPLRVRQAVSALGFAAWLAFMSAVHTRSTAGETSFWVAALLGLILALAFVVFVQWVLEEAGVTQTRYNPAPIPFVWPDDQGTRVNAWFEAIAAKLPASEEEAKDEKHVEPASPPEMLGSFVGRKFQSSPRLQNGLAKTFKVLGPGYCEYNEGGTPTGTLPGHLLALGSSALVLLALVTYGNTWYVHPATEEALRRMPGWFHWLPNYWMIQNETQWMSALSMLMSGVYIALLTFSALSFFADRYHVPLLAVMLAMITLSYWVVGSSDFFQTETLNVPTWLKALPPAAVLERSPARVIVVAAAGGGIQASGWTAQVLSGLREDPASGAGFTSSLRVISAVSGGAVGTLFYLGTYDKVWGAAYSPDEARKRAMASSLPAVAWGLVYPDLNQTLFPLPFFKDIDRGTMLERSFAQTAGKSPGPKLLDLAPAVAEGLPVFLFNSTLSKQALPVVFTNSRLPERRSIRDFHADFRLETRLETAARLSASFPWVSPAARPGQLQGEDAFLDGGYFDNSGLYSLMGWLEEAAETMPPGAGPREVLLVQIDAFPEPRRMAPGSGPVQMSWYNQLAIPLETVVGVRETGQAARIQYEFPLLAKNLEGRIKIGRLQFRYRPSPRCELEPPPLSWHLSEFEKDCIREGWEESRIRQARLDLTQWLAGGALPR